MSWLPVTCEKFPFKTGLFLMCDMGLCVMRLSELVIGSACELYIFFLACRGDHEVRARLGQDAILLHGLVHLLRRGSDTARYWGCMCMSALVHKHTENQNAMAHYPGVIDAIREVLQQQENCASRGAACCILVEMSFRNAGNALLVAKTPGMMHGVLMVLQSSVGDVRDDAAGVLRNCSNYSQEAAEAIVQTPQVLDALIAMCRGQTSDCFLAVAVIQNLSRCESIVPTLRKTRVVEEALEPSLQVAGDGEQHEVMRAEALMAITNLSTSHELQGLSANPEVVGIIVEMLRCAVREKGQSWKDVAW